MYAQIGNIVLSAALGFSAFSEDRGSNIVEHPVIDGKPRLQKIGNELNKIKFNVTLHAAFTSVEDKINEFNNYADNAIPVPITLGTGEFLGYYILPSVKKTLEHTSETGKIIKCDLEISAIEFTGVVQSSNNGFALSSNNPSTLTKVNQKVPLTGQISSEVVTCNNLSKEINGDLNTADKNQTSRNKAFKSIARKIQTIDSKLANVMILSANVFLYVNEANNLKQRIKLTRNSLAVLKNACDIKDVNGARNANVAFQDSINKTTNLAGVFTQQYALRRSI